MQPRSGGYRKIKGYRQNKADRERPEMSLLYPKWRFNIPAPTGGNGDSQDQPRQGGVGTRLKLYPDAHGSVAVAHDRS